jgi:hypothetical protein
MLVHEARVGMKVMFGRSNGEQTLGEIVKINPTKAKVKTLESRGSGRGSMAGAVWGVPYSLMKPVTNGDAVLHVPHQDPADLPVPYTPFANAGDNHIMEAILDCYARLSPEWLTCDGELPQSQVVARRNQLNNRLKHLFQALGRPVSESVACQWDDERRKVKREAV